MYDSSDKAWIGKTIELAEQSVKHGFDPFAAILVKDNKEVYSTEDKCIQYIDPTAHAELIVISEYCRKNKLIGLEGYTLYCTIEPCIMCSGAIHWAKISKVVFSVHQHSLQEISGGKPKPACFELINSGGKSVEIVGGIEPEKGLALLKKHPYVSKKLRL